MTHHDPTGPFGYVPDRLSRASDSLQRATGLADAAARTIAEWVTAGLPMDAFRANHYRRQKAAEAYAYAVYVEAKTLSGQH